MKVTRVCCQGCGADLEVSETIRFVTCNYCNAKLEVVHDPSTTHTKFLDELVEKTDSMAGDLKVIQCEMELQRIERAWDSAQRTFMVTDKNGRQSVPSAVGSIIGGILTVVFGIFWISFAASMDAPGIFPLFGILFVVLAFFGMLRGATKSNEYRSARRSYETRRSEALRKVGEAKRGAKA